MGSDWMTIKQDQRLFLSGVRLSSCWVKLRVQRKDVLQDNSRAERRLAERMRSMARQEGLR